MYASRLAPFFHIYICNLANSEDPEEMPHDASFLIASTEMVF